MKNISLELIRDLLQDFAESLAHTLDLEITIADHNFVRIVGTGVFKDKIFQQLPVGSVYRTSIVNCKPFLVEHAVVSEYCKDCEFRKKCNVMAEVCAPITFGNKVLGVIGIVAMDDFQKQQFLKKRIDYYNTILRLAELIKIIFEFQELGEMGKFPFGITQDVTFDMILGKSDKMLDAIKLAKKAAQTDANVLIEGECGTGKELFSKGIHSASPRRNFVFEPINCCAIPDTLLESELFGYEEGAFTGARRGGKIGKFQFAHNGTIFLDEIGDMSLQLQARLLRILEDRYVVKLGGVKHILINTRVIAATNQDLKKLVKQGKFREDLYYRLNVISIFIPPLLERGNDIDILAEFFFEKYNKLYKKSIKSIEPKLLNHFRQYSWPGNIRELKNLIEYGVLLEDESVLHEKTVLSRFENVEYINKCEAVLSSLSEKVRGVEGIMVKEALNKFSEGPFPVDKAAKFLGISRATLYRKLKYSQN